ncbi:SDR family oxidoreductase [Janthinobacterium sp. HSC-3S05]|uniref:SDR family oxidoreductase n=1 Tax=Janthinobacterium lividum TaxID=29581 RepID=UPI001CD8E557|nr:SDR family oxidoreductase [Janthinobacterium lividum]MCA1860534.1 SDR family oxidoreductase [Janthinobacterium lividum]
MSRPLVVVSGAGSGIGAAVARQFSAAGHPLLLIGRRKAALEALDLPQSICAALDVGDAQAVQDAVRQAEQRHGTVDCLVNSAGIMRLAAAAGQDAAEFAEMLNTNVVGSVNLVQSVLPGMLRQRRGTVFNVSSIAGRQAFPMHAGYCASKFAVHGYTAALGLDMAEHNIRVSTVSPGVVDTPLLRSTTSASARVMFEEWLGTLDSLLAPEDVAGIIAFAYQLPQSVCMREIFVTSTSQGS